MELPKLKPSDEEYLQGYFRGRLRCGAFCTADVVLALLRDDRIEAAEEIVGRKVQRLPDDSRLSPKPLPPHAEHARAQRVVRVSRNPMLPTTPAFLRYKEFKVGRTKDQLMARGVTHRDIRKAVQRGYVEFS